MRLFLKLTTILLAGLCIQTAIDTTRTVHGYLNCPAGGFYAADDDALFAMECRFRQSNALTHWVAISVLRLPISSEASVRCVHRV